MEKIILKIEKLHKHYDGIVILDNADFSINQSTIAGVFGENGAGKTTFFNLISGFESADKGRIFIDNIDITNKSVLQRAKLGIGRLFQNPRIFSDISVMDNLLAAGNNTLSSHLINYLIKPSAIRAVRNKEIEKANKILRRIKLEEKANLKAFELSMGEKRLLSLGCLLMNDVKFLLLDEPFAGINNNMIELLKEQLLLLKKEGITILMIEHDKEVLQEIADDIYELKQGKLNKVLNAK